MKEKGFLSMGIKEGTSVFIGDQIEVKFVKIRSKTWVQVAISAPKDLKILRESLLKNDSEEFSDTSLNK